MNIWREYWRKNIEEHSKYIQKMKENGEKACWIVVYDSVFASYAEEAGVDMILCGDSMGMIVYGWPVPFPSPWT